MALCENAVAVAAVLVFFVVCSSTAFPIGSCIDGVNFIADDSDLCSYYQCVFGSPLRRLCAKGTRMPTYYQLGEANPCTFEVSESKCLRCEYNDTQPPEDPIATYCQQLPGLCGPCDCVNVVAGYWCNCSVTPPTLPTQPSDPVPFCAVNVCQNNGICYKLYDEKPFCNCQPGFTGDLCQFQLCDFNPCQHGGQCVLNGTGIRCDCPRCFTGSCCEYEVTNDPACGGSTEPSPTTTPTIETTTPEIITCDPCHFGVGCSQTRTWLCACNPCPTDELCSDTEAGTTRRCSRGSGSCASQFTLMFEENWNNQGAALEIYVTACEDDNLPRTVNVYAPWGAAINCPYNETMTIQPNTVARFNASLCLRHDGSGLDQKGIRVDEVNGRSITVYAINRATFSADSWLALPDQTAGRNFVVISYKGFQEFRSQFGVVAIYDNTTVNIYPSAVTTVDPSFGNPSITVLLQASETFQVQAELLADLSGSIVLSSRPVHVVAGHVRAYVGASTVNPLRTNVGTPSRDHLVEEIPSTDYWGQTFAVVPISHAYINYTYSEVVLRIVGYQDTNCTVYSSDPLAPNLIVILSSPLYFWESYVNADFYYFVECSQPVLLMELSQSNLAVTSSLIDDPALMYIPAVKQYSNYYKFAPPTYSNSGLPYRYIFTKLAARTGQHALITINNLVPDPLHPWSDVPVPSNPNTADYPALSGGVFNLPRFTTSTIRHPNSLEHFLCIVYSADDRESVGHVAGTSLSIANSGLVPRIPV